MIACPHDVIGYDHEPGAYKPFHLEEELGPRQLHPRREGLHLVHPRACPRFRAWEPEADEHLFARVRQPDELSGIYQDILLTRASDEMVHQMGQDGGLVSALLIWSIENGYIDAALVSYLEGDGHEWKARPGGRRQQGGDPRQRRQPLHLLGQHAGPQARRSSAATAAWRSSA